MARGRQGRPWELLKKAVRARETVCYRCGGPLDWSIPYWHGTVIGVDAAGNDIVDDGQRVYPPDAPTIEHKVPLSVDPSLAEDLANLAASHARCNKAAGATTKPNGLGIRSREW